MKQQLEITKFEKFRVELEHREINFLYAKHCVCLNGYIDIDCTQVITNVLNQVLFHIFFYIVKLKQVLFHIFFSVHSFNSLTSSVGSHWVLLTPCFVLDVFKMPLRFPSKVRLVLSKILSSNFSSLRRRLLWSETTSKCEVFVADLMKVASKAGDVSLFQNITRHKSIRLTTTTTIIPSTRQWRLYTAHSGQLRISSSLLCQFTVCPRYWIS